MLHNLQIKPEDFYLPQFFKEDYLNFNLAGDLVKTINDISILSDKCYTVFDYHKKEFIYISEKTELLNINKNEKRKGYDFLIENSDNEDIFLMLQLQKRAYAFLLTQKLEERSSYVFSTVVSVMSCDGKVDVIYRIKPQVLDKSGNIWLSIATLEKTNRFILPQVRNIKTGQTYYFKPSEISGLTINSDPLTKQELNILNQLAGEKTPMSICNELNIKEPTFKRHRAEIYRKLNVNNKIKAINRAYYLGLIL